MEWLGEKKANRNSEKNGMSKTSRIISDGVKCGRLEYQKEKKERTDQKKFWSNNSREISKINETKTQIQRAQTAPSTIVINKSTPVHNTFTLQETKGKRENQEKLGKRFYCLEKRGCALQQASRRKVREERVEQNTASSGTSYPLRIPQPVKLSFKREL